MRSLATNIFIERKYMNTNEDTEICIIFTCAGKQERWGNAMGCPKHLVQIKGQPLLKRNIDLACSTFGVSSVYVSIASEEQRSLYSVDPRIKFFITGTEVQCYPALYSVLPLVEKMKGDVIVMLGDVFFSPRCLTTVKEHMREKRAAEPRMGDIREKRVAERMGEIREERVAETREERAVEIHIFGRPSEVENENGHSYGELYCFYIPHEKIQDLKEICEDVKLQKEQERIRRFAGWEVLATLSKRYLRETPIPRNLINTKIPIYRPRGFIPVIKYDWTIEQVLRYGRFPPEVFTTINDETDDFDLLSDWKNWTQNHPDLV